MHTLSVAALAIAFSFTPVAHAGSPSGTSESAQSAGTEALPTPKHKVRISHHHHIARLTHKHMFAAREHSRARVIDAREVRMTADLNERQLREERAGVMSASYGPAAPEKNAADQDKKKPVTGMYGGGGGTAGGSGMTGGTVHN
jgi:hypothetical protein